MNWFIRIVAIVGVLFFSLILSLTFVSKDFVEKYGEQFIETVIVEKVDKKIDSSFANLTSSKIGRYAEKLLASKKQELESVKDKFKNQTAHKISLILADMKNLDCECRKKYEQFIADSFKLQLLDVESSILKIEGFAKSKYMEVARDLKRDIRIFSITNILALGLLLILSFLKPQAFKHLMLPAILLFISTCICSYFYIFEQNWFLTIIYSDYLGYWYSGYLVIVFLFLVDIFLNKARVTTEIINAFFNAIGSAVSVTPC